MAQGLLESRDFEKYLSLSEQKTHDAALASNYAFAAAMNREIRRGRIHAEPGTFVDSSPAIYARRMRGELAISACGSPAALCFDNGGAPSGAGEMK